MPRSWRAGGIKGPTTAKQETQGVRGAGAAQEIREVRAGGAQEIREVRAGEAHEAALEDLPGPIDSRAGGARKILGVDETREENAGAGGGEVARESV